MELLIAQKSDNIEVILDNNLYMKVVRDYDWIGRLISNYYKQGELILTTSYFVFFLFTIIKILFKSNKFSHIELIKQKGKYLIETKNIHIYSYRKFGLYNNCEIFINENKIGELKVVKTMKLSTDLQYKLTLNSSIELLDEILVRLFLDFQSSLPSE